MDRRKDTPFTGVNLPRDYLNLVEDVFNKNFSVHLLTEKGKPEKKSASAKKGAPTSNKEKFVVYGQIFTDELVLAVSLKNPSSLRMITCYASVDYPPAQFKGEHAKKNESVSQAVEMAVNFCVDAVASFFQTFFQEERPVDYDLEYRQNWTPIDLDKTTRVFLRINRDNLELEEQADALLERDGDAKNKKKLH